LIIGILSYLRFYDLSSETKILSKITEASFPGVMTAYEEEGRWIVTLKGGEAFNDSYYTHDKEQY